MGDAKVSLFVKVEHHKSHGHWAMVIHILDESASIGRRTLLGGGYRVDGENVLPSSTYVVTVTSE